MFKAMEFVSLGRSKAQKTFINWEQTPTDFKLRQLTLKAGLLSNVSVNRWTRRTAIKREPNGRYQEITNQDSIPPVPENVDLVQLASGDNVANNSGIASMEV